MLRAQIWLIDQQNLISTLNYKLLKLVDQFIYFGSNISLTESNVNLRIGKTLTAIDSLSTIWKSDLFDKKKNRKSSKL